MKISFDKSLKSQFMAAQNLTSDSSGYLSDAKTNKRVVDEKNQPIKSKNYGGFRKGSRIYLAKDIETVINEAAIDKKQKKQDKK